MSCSSSAHVGSHVAPELLSSLRRVRRGVKRLLTVCGRMSSALLLVQVETAVPAVGGLEACRPGWSGRGRRSAGWSSGDVG